MREKNKITRFSKKVSSVFMLVIIALQSITPAIYNASEISSHSLAEKANASETKSQESSEDKSQESSEDKSQESSEDKSQESSEDKSQESSEDKSQESSEDKSQESSEDKSQESSEKKSQESSESKSQESSEDKSQESSESKSQESSEDKSQESSEESQLVNDTEEQANAETKDAKAFTKTDFHGVGNENTSGIGKATYIQPSEEQEDAWKTIDQMQSEDSKYLSVTDLNKSLIDTALNEYPLQESIMPRQFPTGTSEADINADIAADLTYNGSCWSNITSNSARIVKDVHESDTCSLTLKDAGLYYNVNTMESKPVDLTLDVDFLDFFTYESDMPGTVYLDIGIDSNGIIYNTFRTDELQLTTTYTDSSTGAEVNVPLFYDLEDIDAGASFGFDMDDVHLLATFYQDPATSPYGQYSIPTYNSSDALYESSANTFNYQTVYDYIYGLYTAGGSESHYNSATYYYPGLDRSEYNSYQGIVNAGGNFEPEERGWNRLKINQIDNYVTLFDTWGSNTGPSTVDWTHVSNGNDGEAVVVVDSNTTFTLNQSNHVFGPAAEAGKAVGVPMVPYTPLVGTIVDKTATDENGDGKVQAGEKITYSLKFTNLSPENPMLNVPVRDSMLESLPSYISWDGSYSVSPSGTTTSGNLADGSLTIDRVEPVSDVTITYTIKVNEIPNGVGQIANVVTDDGEDPAGLCDSTDETEDCAGTETPVAPETIITKSVSNSSGKTVAKAGDDLTYTINVKNPNTAASAYKVPVKDSLLESLPSYLSWDGTVAVTGNKNTFTGSLGSGNFVLDEVQPGQTVSIKYKVHIKSLPDDITQIANVATDNGDNPAGKCTSTTGTKDCAGTETPVSLGTSITKAVSDSSGDGIAQVGDTLTYTISVKNLSTVLSAKDVPVRDSMLESLPSYLSFNPSSILVSGNTNAYTGSLTDGSFKLTEIKPGQTVTVKYSVEVTSIPNDLGEIKNVATDNGQDPDGLCTSSSGTADCAGTETPTDPDTIITKTVSDASGDKLAQVGEQLTYTISIQNPNTKVDALKVPVKDSLLEAMPSYLSWDGTISVAGNNNTFTGSIKDGTMVLDRIKAGNTVTITYKVTVNSIPNNIKEVVNTATDNGQNPDGLCDSISGTKDCAGTETPMDPETTITKSVEDSGKDGFANIGDELTYTLSVTNPSSVASSMNVPVRDSLVESTPSFLTYEPSSLTVTGNTNTHSGDLPLGTFKLDEVKPNNTVKVTYKFKVKSIPDNVSEIDNVATDNGQDPDGLCDSTSGTVDCAGTETVVDPETIITKTVSDASGDGYGQIGEKLTYELDVTNPSSVADAVNVPVRDSLLESMPARLTWDGNISVSGNDDTYTGDIKAGTMKLDRVRAKQTVTITYDVTINSIPNNIAEVANVVTDTGISPKGECTSITADEIDCDGVEIPMDPETTISKSVEDANGDGLAQPSEELTYTIRVKNPNTVTSALNVPVRDSLLENISSYPYLSWDGNITITGNNNTFKGSIANGSLVLDEVKAGNTVTITYKIKLADELPDDVHSVINLVTDNGQNPETECELGKSTVDCGSTEIITNPDTMISKSILSESMDKDNIIEDGEDITYRISVKNTSTVSSAMNVPVRDSLLESLPSYLTWDGAVTVTGNLDDYTGSLGDGSFVLSEVRPGKTVTIDYTLHVGKVPDDVESIGNLVTDNGAEPDQCLKEDKGDDCDELVRPTSPDTNIDKSVEDESGDGLVQPGEKLSFTITVANHKTIDALDVPVRDSLLESLPTYLTYNDDMNVKNSGYSGNLKDGTLVLDKVAAKDEVYITYSVTMTDPIPNDLHSVINLVTDNGADPKTECTAGTMTDNCDSTETVTDPDTLVSKASSDADGDGYIEPGETVHYTISVKNPNTVSDAVNVAVRDNLLEHLPSYLSWDGNITVTGNDNTYTGSIADGSMVLDYVRMGETVTIEYDLVMADEIPNDVGSVGNLATDNGQDPDKPIDPDKPEEICPVDDPDCAITVDPVDPDTMISKSILSESMDKDNIIEDGEDITYRISVENTSTVSSARDINVRDSLLESLPTYLTWDGTVTVTGNTDSHSGNLGDGSFILDEVKPEETVTIDYTLHVGKVPGDVESIGNLVTDNGAEPDQCLDADRYDDCDQLVRPTNPDTVIDKSVEDESGDGLVQPGEKLTYTIEVINLSTIDALDVPVRDSLIESLPTYLTYNDDMNVKNSGYSGNLKDGTLVLDKVAAKDEVYITYSVTMTDPIPNDLHSVINLVTDNGADPKTECTAGTMTDDCDSTETVTDPDTLVSKASSDADGDGYIEPGETVHYTISVEDPNTVSDAVNVPVRDNLLEHLPSYLSWDGNITVTGNDNTYTGSIADGSMVLDYVRMGETVTIEYDLVMADEIPNDVGSVGNLATDNGQDPDKPIDPDKPEEICPVDDPDCAITVDPVDPDTVIHKELVNESKVNDGIIEDGEKLTYEITVANPNELATAREIHVRDSLLENLPTWIRYNGKLTVDPASTEYSGSLSDGSFVIAEIAPKDEVKLTYTVNVLDVPEGETFLPNIVTDNAVDPDRPVDPDNPDAVCDELNPEDDCSEVVRPYNPETTINKSSSDANGDGFAQDGEVITYTLRVTNDTKYDSLNVKVRDNLIENSPSWITYNDDMKVIGSKYSGDLKTADLNIDKVPAKSYVDVVYSITLAEELPSHLGYVLNIATDDGTDPDRPVDPSKPEDACDEETDANCSDQVVSFDPDTLIHKDIIAESKVNDGIIEDGEDITYQVTIANPNHEVPALNVEVRDSILENLPEWVTYDGNLKVSPKDTITAGSLSEGTFTIRQIPRDSNVKLTYTVHVGDVPEVETTIGNLVTDNGQDPIEPCSNEDSDDDCSRVTRPYNPETVIEKSISDESKDGYIQTGETIKYVLTVSNPRTIDSLNVHVRDSLLENTPDYLTYNNDLDVAGATTTGDITDGTLVLNKVSAKSKVTLTYTMTMGEIPNDVSEVLNLATDDGTDPNVPVETCDENTDNCDHQVLPVDPETVVEKSVEDSSGDGYVQPGEVINYTISVTNPNSQAKAVDVPVRDSLVENTPSYLTYNKDAQIAPEDRAVSGSLAAGTYVVSEIEPGETVNITYTMTMADPIPEDLGSIVNIVTDNGQDPIDPELVCNEEVEDCAGIEIPVDPDTIIEKSMTDSNSDGYVQPGEVLNYQITVTNTSSIANSQDVLVRDNLVENTPDYLTYNKDLTVNPSGTKTTGSLVDGTYTISEIPANSSVTLSYSMTVGDPIPANVETILNIATDDGQDPTDPDFVCKDKLNCDDAKLPVDAETVIKKSVVDSKKVYEQGDNIKYQIDITNNSKADSIDVPVRDNLLENTPDYLSYNDDMKVKGSKYSGTLEGKDLILNKVKAGQTVTITYSMKLITTDNIETVTNIATDDGSNPNDSKHHTDDSDFVVVNTVEQSFIKMLADTGSKAQLILINLVAIAIIGLYVKRKIA